MPAIHNKSKIKNLLLSGSCLLAAGFIVASPAQAADFTITDGQTVTVGQNLNNPGETGAIESGGTLNVAGAGINVSVAGTNATINNAGSISTTGGGADPLFISGANATIINSGSINTAGGGAAGIFLNTTAANGVITNSGSISGSGVGAYGIYSQGANTVITNSGTVMVSGAGTNAAIDLDSGGADNSTLMNTGTIMAVNGATEAIEGGTGSQLLTLGAGSRIIGTVDLGGGTDTINILGNTSSTLTVVGVENVNFTGGASGFFTGGVITSVDTTGQAALATTVNAVNFDIHNTINGRVNAPASSSVKLASAAPSHPADVEPAAGGSGSRFLGDGTEVWAEIFGGHLSRGGEGATLSFDQNYYGLVSGYERGYDSGRYGVTFGFANSVIGTDVQSIDTDVLSFFGGVYGHMPVAPNLTLSTNLIVGYEDYDNRRTVVDNIAGTETAQSDFNNVFISPSVSLTYDQPLSNGLRLRPSGSLVYTASFFDGYTESGTTNSNLSVDDRNVQTLNTRAQVGLAKVGEGFDLEFRAGIDGRFSDEDDIDGTLAGNSFSFTSSDDDSVIGGFVGVNAQFVASDRLSIVADTEFRRASGDESEFSGRLRGVLKF